MSPWYHLIEHKFVHLIDSEKPADVHGKPNAVILHPVMASCGSNSFNQPQIIQVLSKSVKYIMIERTYNMNYNKEY